MTPINDARLHIVVAIGVPILGYMFSTCWNYEGSGNFYTVPSSYPFCVNFGDVSAFSVVPLKWLVAASACVILLSIYRLWSGQNSN